MVEGRSEEAVGLPLSYCPFALLWLFKILVTYENIFINLTDL